MTLTKLASMIAKKEGKKSQAAIGNIREILKVLIDLEVEAMMMDAEEDQKISSPIIALIDRSDVVLRRKLNKRKTKNDTTKHIE